MKVKRIIEWSSALNACRTTRDKELLDKDPSDKFKADLIRSRHKPLEIVQYEITGEIKSWIYQHFRTHSNTLMFCGSRRDDLSDKPRDPEGLVPFYMLLSAENILHISEQRLCNIAHKETIQQWNEILLELREIEPMLFDRCVPKCITIGYCNESKSCGYVNTYGYKSELQLYRSRYAD